MPVPATAADIARATKSAEGSVAAVLPLFQDAIKDLGIGSDPRVLAGLYATVAAECHFRCVIENGNAAYFQKNYEGRKDLGNIHPGDGAKFCGRGFIQITGRANYAKYGKLIGVDLENHPELALQPKIAAKILVAYFKDHGCDIWSQRGDWRKVRKLVNGGLNGFDVFQDAVYNLLEVFYK